MKIIFLLFAGLAFLINNNQAQTVIDIDGNVYNILTIPPQYWLKENLKVTHYSNGDIIPNVTNSSLWQNLSTGAWCTNSIDSISNIYGNYYNYFSTIDSRGLCPTGWHVPHLIEIEQLFNSNGGSNIAGGKLKDTIYWDYPNTGANNVSGFSALPGSYCSSNAAIGSTGYVGVWYTSDSSFSNSAYSFALYADREICAIGNQTKQWGFSIRCLADSSTLMQLNEYKNQVRINIYPNPSSDQIYIRYSDFQIVTMQIYNMIGDCILQKVLNNRINEIDISSLSKGIYIIKLSGANWTFNHKMTKL